MMSSSPSIPPDDDCLEFIDSLDAKIIQYQYAISKLQLLVPNIRKLGARAQDLNYLPLVQYIVLLSGNMFAINENSFSNKLELLECFKLFKSATISISPAVAHIPYDNPDIAVCTLSELPKKETSYKCLKLLEVLCFNCLQGYQKRLQQAKIEKDKSNIHQKFFQDLESVIKNEILHANDIDIGLGDDFFIELPEDEKVLTNDSFVEATLIDMDIKMIFTITSQLQSLLDKLKPTILQFKHARNLPKSSQDKYFKQLPNWKYSLHMLFAITLRLNDIYTIFRKFGRKIYLSNRQHLNDQKFLFQAKNSNYFKLNLLKEVEELFNATKKNGTLIATLTRFVRQNSRHEISSKNILDFINFINQGYLIIESSVAKFEEFGHNWITAELRFRKVYSLPRINLINIFQFIQGSNDQISPSGSINSNTNLPATKKNPQSLQQKVEPSPEVIFETIDEGLQKLEISDSSKAATRSSRSSSISSINSNNSVNKVTTNAVPLKNSFISPTNRNSLLLSKNVSLPRKRPNSMLFINSNGSLSNIQSSVNESPTASPTGRRRSNSQPIKASPSIVSSENSLAATSGAAAAITRRNSYATLRSPSPSIMRSPSLTNRKPQQVKLPLSPTPTKNQKQLIVVEEEDDSIPNNKPLTANQRLQQHLKQASKSGTLMTQPKELFTTVSFNPNSPSSYNMRRYIESPPADQGSNSSPSKLNAQKRQIMHPITKSNVQKNNITVSNSSANTSNTSSVTIDPHNNSISSISSTSSANNGDSALVKKVRFTGVPEYTEAEDAPTKYSTRILKNFGVFKNPIIINKPSTFKKRDQLLKKEESLSFKSQIHSEDQEKIYLPPPVTKPFGVNRLSKLKNKLI